MSLAPGTRVGPYEVVELLGAGGMGEVHRARDPRLGREVAVKVLHGTLEPDSEPVRRFLTEARATGALNHPGVLAVFDVGVHEGAPYVVSELLEGETLRQRLAQGPIPVRRALEFAVQIAHGLAAAHERGIVHRDLKPENLFLTRDGRLKILDFGLAKLLRPDADPARSGDTSTGTILGTAGYMAPEQVSGQPADPRSDIFALGSVLFEMLSGRRAFAGKSSAETMLAVLRDDPPDLLATSRLVPPAVERVVRRCLEKRPDDRFGSARDVAFALEALAGTTSGSATLRALQRPRLRRPPFAASLALVGLAALGAGFLAGKRSAPPPRPAYQELTFRRGFVPTARFASDGKTVVYSAAWDGEPSRVFVKRPEDDESTALVAGAELLSVSRTGQIAVLLRPRRMLPFSPSGTLATLALGGGVPHEVLEHVHGADWAPDGKRLAVVRDVEGRSVLEVRDVSSPAAARTLHESGGGYLSHPRFSPSGDRIAFFEHRYREGALGALLVVDLAGQTRVVAEHPAVDAFNQVAWSGEELLFHREGVLVALSQDGSSRELLRPPGRVILHDVSAEGQVLASEDDFRQNLACQAGDEPVREMTWLGVTRGIDISPDGQRLLFIEYGGQQTRAGLRGLDGSPIQRLGQGEPKAFSPDGRSILTETSARPPRLALLPVGPGEARPWPALPGLERINYAALLPGGERIVFTGNEPGRAVRLFVHDATGGAPRAFSKEGIYYTVLAASPDGRSVAAVGPTRRITIYPIDGGEPFELPEVEPEDQPIRFGSDGALYSFRLGPIPTPVYRFEPATGRTTLRRHVVPPDRAGVLYTAPRYMTADARTYCFQYPRILSRLYQVEGLAARPR